MQESYFTVLDIETTGLSRYMHRITEFAGLKIKYNSDKGMFEKVDEYSTLINPEVHIPRFITSLTGITDSMVLDAPKFNEISGYLDEFLDGSVIVAHNSTFDYNFLDHNLKRSGVESGLNNHALCTCKLSRRLVPNLKSYKLSSLCRHFEVENMQAHRARADVLATKEVFERLTRLMYDRGVSCLKDALALQRARISSWNMC